MAPDLARWQPPAPPPSTHTHGAGAADGTYSGLAGFSHPPPEQRRPHKGEEAAVAARTVLGAPTGVALPGGRGILSPVAAKLRGGSARCSRGRLYWGLVTLYILLAGVSARLQVTCVVIIIIIPVVVPRPSRLGA